MNKHVWFWSVISTCKLIENLFIESYLILRFSQLKVNDKLKYFLNNFYNEGETGKCKKSDKNFRLKSSQLLKQPLKGVLDKVLIKSKKFWVDQVKNIFELAHALVKWQNKEMQLYWTKSSFKIIFRCFLIFNCISIFHKNFTFI